MIGLALVTRLGLLHFSEASFFDVTHGCVEN